MFTIRVEHDKGSRTMYAAKQYKVFPNGKRSARLTVNNDDNWATEIVVENGEVAYVMNDAGQTVDTIRTERSLSGAPHGS